MRRLAICEVGIQVGDDSVAERTDYSVLQKAIAEGLVSPPSRGAAPPGSAGAVGEVAGTGAGAGAAHAVQDGAAVPG